MRTFIIAAALLVSVSAHAQMQWTNPNRDPAIDQRNEQLRQQHNEHQQRMWQQQQELNMRQQQWEAEQRHQEQMRALQSQRNDRPRRMW